ncbi:MAG: EF-hand domain-containing protein [Pseudomonadota bacterium]
MRTKSVISNFAISLAGATAVLFFATSAVAAPNERAARLDRMLERMDTDQSGALSYDEFIARPNQRFEKTDANGDGILSAEERENAKAERSARGGKPGQKRAGLGAGLLRKMDSNNDGDISRSEHDAHHQARFSRIDLNADGALTKDEFIADMQARRTAFKDKRG